jgi:hypothetical protein
MSSISFVEYKKFLKEPLQWTTRGSTRKYAALEGNSRFYEKRLMTIN